MTDLPVAEQRLVGRLTGGHVADLTPAQVSTLLGFDAVAPCWPRSAVNPSDPAGGTFAPGTNALVATAFLIERPQPLNAIGFKVATQSGNVDVAIFDDDGTGGAAHTRLVSSGSVSCPATGLATVSIASTVLQPGWYWAGIVFDNNTAAIYYSASVLGNPFRSMRSDATTTFPIPAAITGTLNANPPYFVLPGMV